jgi:hypothetical protein
MASSRASASAKDPTRDASAKAFVMRDRFQ